MEKERLSTKEKRLFKLLLEAMEIIDKGSMYGIDIDDASVFYKKAHNYVNKHQITNPRPRPD
jgi:hypothetical protein